MSKEDLCTHFKQRFKGVENFLRRVAFNLGNTPSQTEVKIISCIPIDVTDLQQKIFNLEKQLNEATGCRSQAVAENNTPCATALYTTNYPGASSTNVICNQFERDRGTSPLQAHCDLTSPSSSRNKSTESFNACPSIRNCYCKSSTVSTNRQISIDQQSQPLIISEPQKEKRRSFFRKKKKVPKKKKVNTQFVYYAQTNNTPFRNIDNWNVLDEMEANTSDGLTKSYLANMIRRQYRPKRLGCNISDISEYSSPVCRDNPQGCRLCPYETDVCSCCRGQFHNLDNQRSKEPVNNSTHLHETNTGSSYYDSSLYDLVPVKEKPMKITKDFEMPVKKENKPQVDVMCWPEETRAMIPRFRPFIVNYHTISPTRTNYLKSIPRNLKGRNTIIEKMATKRKKAANFSQQMDVIASKSCCVEFGNVYAKKMRNKPKAVKVESTPPPQRKDAECLTTTINHTECQTVMSNAQVKKTDVKTEATLNQIKIILQSVLTEVKTNSQIKHASDDKPKRDAVVQKGASQSNLQGSTYLNSFTYSPYNMNPYIASRSLQMNSSHFCHPQPTMKCLQNFPLIIQSGRHMCNSCYKNNSNIKSMCPKQATTTSTNTGEVKERNKETEKLIKEIYKSMAINADILTKDTSNSEYENLQSIHEFEDETIEEPELEIPKKVVRAISEVYMKAKIQASSEKNTSSKCTSNTVSTKSQSVSTDTEKTNKKHNIRVQKNRTESVSVSTAVEIRTPPEEDLKVVTATESESSSSDVETDVTYVPEKVEKVPQVQKKEKKSLFSKMFKSVFKTKDKPNKSEFKMETETESISDSDDYQTIYSQKVEKPKYRPRAVASLKQKTHSKISNSKQVYRERSPDKFRRSPYMEQEYRRHWNERLMFEKQGKMYSSERPISIKTTPRNPAYFQNYEARTAVVKPRVSYCPRERYQETARPCFKGQDSGKPYFRKVNGQNGSYAKRDRSLAEQNNGKAKFDSKGAKGLAWLRKHKMGIHCGEQWKKLILEG